jgi:hypothetical protein
MKILIIGGSGFVSGTLAREAMKAGWDVTVITRGRRPVPEGAARITADRDQPPTFAEAVRAHRQEWDLVVDCIGMTPAHAQQGRERGIHLFASPRRKAERLEPLAAPVINDGSKVVSLLGDIGLNIGGGDAPGREPADCFIGDFLAERAVVLPWHSGTGQFSLPGRGRAA